MSAKCLQKCLQLLLQKIRGIARSQLGGDFVVPDQMSHSILQFANDLASGIVYRAAFEDFRNQVLETTVDENIAPYLLKLRAIKHDRCSQINLEEIERFLVAVAVVKPVLQNAVDQISDSPARLLEVGRSSEVVAESEAVHASIGQDTEVLVRQTLSELVAGVANQAASENSVQFDVSTVIVPPPDSESAAQLGQLSKEANKDGPVVRSEKGKEGTRIGRDAVYNKQAVGHSAAVSRQGAGFWVKSALHFIVFPIRMLFMACWMLLSTIYSGAHQIAVRLNGFVLDYAIPNILINIEQHLYYRKDVSKIPKPLEHPKYISTAGTRTNPNYIY